MAPRVMTRSVFKPSARASLTAGQPCQGYQHFFEFHKTPTRIHTYPRRWHDIRQGVQPPEERKKALQRMLDESLQRMSPNEDPEAATAALCRILHDIDGHVQNDEIVYNWPIQLREAFDVKAKDGGRNS
eukprot:180238-Amphidinium_carterae.1